MKETKSGKSHKKSTKRREPQRSEVDTMIKTLQARIDSGFTPEIERPTFDFNRLAPEVAMDLKGAVITVAGRDLRIIDASGRENKDIPTPGIFKIAIDQAPGTITGVPYRGLAISPNISVADKGLVWPTALEVPEENGATLLRQATQIARALGLAQGQHMVLETSDLEQKRFTLSEPPQTV